MFTARQLKEKMDQTPFRPFRIRMSNGESHDIPHHDAAWVLRDSLEIGLDPDAAGLVSLTRRCAILHIASIEDIPAPVAA